MEKDERMKDSFKALSVVASFQTKRTTLARTKQWPTMTHNPSGRGHPLQSTQN